MECPDRLGIDVAACFLVAVAPAVNRGNRAVAEADRLIVFNGQEVRFLALIADEVVAVAKALAVVIYLLAGLSAAIGVRLGDRAVTFNIRVFVANDEFEESVGVQTRVGRSMVCFIAPTSSAVTPLGS